MSEMKIMQLIDVIPVSKKLKKEDVLKEGLYPVYSSDTCNNGVLGYTNEPMFTNSSQDSFIIFGDHTKTITIVSTPFSVSDNVKVLKIKSDIDVDPLYLKYVWLPKIPSLGYSRHWKVAKNCSVTIPTKSDDKFDLKKQRELANIYKTIDEQKNNLLNKCYILKDVSIQLNKVSNVSYKDVHLLTLFTPKGGRMDLSKAYCNINKGSYPVYSGTKNNIEFGNINTYDYDGSYLTWIIDGLAGYLQLVSGKFSITCHKGIFLPTANCNNIDLDYIKYVLEPIFRTIKRGRLGEQGKNEYTALKPKHIEMINPVIPIPITSDGSFDLEKQKEIANKYRQIEEIKQGLIKKIKSLVEIKIIPN